MWTRAKLAILVPLLFLPWGGPGPPCRIQRSWSFTVMWMARSVRKFDRSTLTDCANSGVGGRFYSTACTRCFSAISEFLQMVSVGIVSERTLHRDCLEEILRGRSDIEVVATTGASEKVISVAREADVVIVDHNIAGSKSTVRRIAGMHDGPPVVAYGVPETEHHVVEYAEAGAAGIVLDHDSLEDLLAAINGALRHELCCRPAVSAMLAKRLRDLAMSHGKNAGGSALTERESEILELLDIGLSNKEIARRLDVKVATVKNHVHSILVKLNVSRRGEAAAVMNGRLLRSRCGEQAGRSVN